MGTAAILFGIVAVAVIILILAGIGYYNSFVSKRNMVEQSFSTIDVMLKNRYDLIPNLVATVRQYMDHEAATLTRIAELRARAGDSRADVDARVNAINELNRLVGNLMVQVESYPELKANANFLELQSTLHNTEEQLSAARRAFNATVTNFNTSIEMFPGNVIAKLFAFKRRALLETPPEERRTPDVHELFRR